MTLKKLEQGVDISLEVNEGLRNGIGDESLKYGGMSSDRTFTLIQTDVYGKNPYHLSFPACSGVINIHTEYNGGECSKFDVRQVTPNKLILRYLGTE